MYARDKEVEGKGPVGKVGEETKALSDGGIRLLDGVGANVYIFQRYGGGSVREPGVAGDYCCEGVDAE